MSDLDDSDAPMRDLAVSHEHSASPVVTIREPARRVPHDSRDGIAA